MTDAESGTQSEEILKKAILSIILFGATLSAGTVNVQFTGVGNGVVRGNDYVGPYTLSINGGQNINAMCMDDYLEVYSNDQWTANVTSAVATDFSKTYLGNNGEDIPNVGHFSSSDIYHAEAYLFSLITQPGADQSDIQEAAWAIMDPQTLTSELQNNDQPVLGYLELAAQNYSSFDASGYSIISDVNCTKQEFMVADAPEPASCALFGAGALLLAGASRFLRRRSAE